MPDFDEWIKNLKKMLKIEGGPIDEGKKDYRNGVKTGSVRDWLTYPGDVYVTPDDEKYIGDVAIHFTGREAVANYKLGAQTSVDHEQTAGKVTATYEFSFRGNVLITEVVKVGGKGRVGDAVVRHLQGLNGTTVSD